MKNIETTIEMWIYMTRAWNKHANILEEIMKKRLYGIEEGIQTNHTIPFQSTTQGVTSLAVSRRVCPPAGKETQQSTFGLKQVELSGVRTSIRYVRCIYCRYY